MFTSRVLSCSYIYREIFCTLMLFSIKMYLETLCMLLTVGHFAVFAADLCISQDSCRCVKDGGRVVDLSSVGLPGYPRFYEIPVENDTARYSYNPCYAFDSPDKMTTVNLTNVACRGAAACIKSPGGSDGEPPEEHAIGLQSTAKFGSNVHLGLHINYTLPDSEEILTVILVCHNTTEHHLSVISFHNFTDIVYLMKLTSKCVCNNGCVSQKSDDDSGLSTGSILLIVFFTILLSYFVVGVVWNFCNGSQGVELIPNLEFWNDLPKLIIEGVIFTCSCFGRRTSYGEV